MDGEGDGEGDDLTLPVWSTLSGEEGEGKMEQTTTPPPQ
jgi:hypothetical protein